MTKSDRGPAGDQQWHRRWAIVLGGFCVVFGGVLAVLAWSPWVGQVPVGTEVPAVLESGYSRGEVSDETGRWCLEPGQIFPAATSRWSDGIAHGGSRARGVLRYDTDETATFHGEADGPGPGVKLRRITTNRFGCPD